ncbi:hypothetical protein [Microbacterium sp. Root180]|uniref:hypothetical protein n=1 Tax=Microbacterium sp. Root180 TaxID=1736483 RepID=UPI0006FEC173|nr:hypothetical protein [Microbacterium sp. Root180]KRB38697.1 hypothetical protein ASD93_01705 [Microbacterium sp. Root180]
MKKWTVRFLSLLVFNIVVLLVIGFLTPAHVGWSALWAAVVLTAISIWIKPAVQNWFRTMAAKSANQRTKAGEKLIEFLLAFALAFLVWIATVLLSGVTIGGGFFGAFWGYVLPPVILLIGWAIYDAIDDRVEAHAGALYDKASGGRSATATDASAPAIPQNPEASGAGRRELDDGLTDEQRRMLDELGKG